MKEPIEIVILKSGLQLCHPVDCSVGEFVGREEKAVLARISEFIQRTGSSVSVLHLFVAEELLYFKAFTLPLDTPDLDEAVGYQLEALTPFGDEATWHSFEADRREDGYRVTLFAIESRYIDVYVQEIVDAGFQISGLYPESQRFVNRLNRKGRWGLLLPGRFHKIFTFEGDNIESRFLCSDTPSFPEAVEVCKTDLIYRVDPATVNEKCDLGLMPTAHPYFDYIDGRFLLGQKPTLRKHNMLPESFQRPDYTRIIILVLLVLNAVTLLTFGGVKLYQLKAWDRQIGEQIAGIMPLVNETKELRAKEEEQLKAMAQIQGMGKNIDLIGFIVRLTDVVPKSSYVDQLRLDPKAHSIHVQGFTDDVTDLTAKLQTIGDAQLQSTSRRKDKTYFHVEVRLP